MRRRHFIAAVSSTVFGAALGHSARPARADPEPVWRSFEVKTSIKMRDAAGVTRAWLPIPAVRSTYQRVLGNLWEGNVRTARIVADPVSYATMLYAEWAADQTQPMIELTSRVDTRDLHVDLTKPRSAEWADGRPREFYLRPTKLIPTHGVVLDTARREIMRNAHSDLDKARAIYEWIVENTFRDPQVRGCGTGDIRFMLETGNLGGKCADLNALYVGLARAAGLPARDVYGIRVADSRLGYKSLGKSGDISKAQHHRAEVWLQQFGWVPVDPADVRKVVLEEEAGLTLEHPRVQEARQRLFGSWEMNWMAYNTAHDVALPGSNGTVIGFLMYPQAETAAGRRDSLDPDNFSYRITAREIL